MPAIGDLNGDEVTNTDLQGLLNLLANNAAGAAGGSCFAISQRRPSRDRGAP